MSLVLLKIVLIKSVT